MHIFRLRPSGLLVSLVGLLCITSGCQQLMQRQSQSQAADEKAIRDLESEWAKAAAAKDVEKVVSYYAEDGTLFPPNAPIAMGKPTIRQAWTSMMATPGFAISWAPMKVEISKSADMAYSFGTYTLNLNGPQGQPVNDHGKYVVVWKKQTDGSWKAVADIVNTDLPAPGAPMQSGGSGLQPPPG